MPKIEVYGGNRPGAGARPGARARLGTRARPGARRSAIAVAAVVAGCCMSACSGSATLTASTATPSGTPVSSTQAASPGSETGASQGPGAATGAAGSGGAATAGAATPGAVLAAWMHRVAAGNRRAACREVRVPQLSAQRAMMECMSAAAAPEFKSLHTSFDMDGIKPSTPIVVSAQPTSTTMTVSGKQI